MIDLDPIEEFTISALVEITSVMGSSLMNYEIKPCHGFLIKINAYTELLLSL